MEKTNGIASAVRAGSVHHGMSGTDKTDLRLSSSLLMDQTDKEQVLQSDHGTSSYEAAGSPLFGSQAQTLHAI